MNCMCSPWGRRESDTAVTFTFTFFRDMGSVILDLLQHGRDSGDMPDSNPSSF